MEAFIGELRLFAFNFCPEGWAPCAGQVMSISSNMALFSLLGTTYGGDGRTTFGLPNLGGLAPIGVHGHSGNYVQGEVVGPHRVALTEEDTGPGASATMPGFLALNWCIALQGIYPPRT